MHSEVGKNNNEKIFRETGGGCAEQTHLTSPGRLSQEDGSETEPREEGVVGRKKEDPSCSEPRAGGARMVELAGERKRCSTPAL